MFCVNHFEVLVNHMVAASVFSGAGVGVIFGMIVPRPTQMLRAWREIRRG